MFRLKREQWRRCDVYYKYYYAGWSVSVVDDVRDGGSSATRTDENIARVGALLKENRLIICRLVSERLIIPK